MAIYGSNYTYGMSPYYKDDSYGGHIGSFYFGPFGATISADSMEYSVVLLQPTVDIEDITSAAVVTPLPMEVYYVMQNPAKVEAGADITINFIGVPRIGVSPLTVDFEANVTFGGAYQDKYYVTEYHWYFDYENNPSVYETSTGPMITHIYNGYAGQTYDVRLCVEIGVR